jgi:hypothetical protein
MPLPLELRLFVKGQLMEEELVKVLSSPSPPTRTPTTKPCRALYGLDFTGDGGGVRDARAQKIEKEDPATPLQTCSL